MCRQQDMEDQLYDYVRDQRDVGYDVTGSMIRAEALRILEGTNFTALKP
jgi:hypothetical protein